MRKKIAIRIFITGAVIMLLASIVMLAVFQNDFREQVFSSLKKGADAVFDAFVNSNDESLLHSLEYEFFSRTGKGLPPDVSEAFNSGSGGSVHSAGKLGNSAYFFSRLIPGGRVLRICFHVQNMLSVYVRSVAALLIIAFGILWFSSVMAFLLTKSIVRPIEHMVDNIDDIENHIPYPELEPFASSLHDQQLKKQQNERVRQEFTANVSHELKTPLTSISGYAEMIETGLAREGDVKEFAGKIRLESARLLNLIGDIIKLSELDDPYKKEYFEDVDLLEICWSVAEMLTLQASKMGITLIVDGKPAIVTGDKHMLEELVYNLCDNGIRYNKPGGAVHLSVSETADSVVLKVEDTGIGITRSHQSRVFERFYRVDKSRSKETGGTGLGLAIVKHAAMRHGAKLKLTSMEGIGTTVTVAFEK